jgi:hypothetical protein
MFLGLRWPSRITCVLSLSILLCFDILYLGYVRSLCYRITRSVLTRLTLLFFGILLRVGYGLFVCNPCIMRMYRHALENCFHSSPRMVSETLSMIGLSQRTHL